MTKSAYIISIIEDGGFKVGQHYRALAGQFLSKEFVVALQAYQAANTRLMGDIGALIVRFTKHAETELQGGVIIETIGNEAIGQSRNLIIEHGRDEQRHHRMFAAMAARMADDYDFEHLPINKLDPLPVINNLTGENSWKFLICTIHWAEVRNIFILDQYLRCLENSNWKSSNLLQHQISAVLADEKRHVGYTAELLDQIICDDEYFREFTLSYREEYEANCWQEISEMSDFFANHVPVYA